MSSTKSEFNSSKITPVVALQFFLFYRYPPFTVEVGIGTPPTKARLIFDTVAPLTWTQCKPCNSCFWQDYRRFDPKKSISYKKMNQNHTFAPLFNCIGRPECIYHVATGSGLGLGSYGTLSIDNLSFLPTLKTIKNIVFGWEKVDHRFSYCLRSSNKGRPDLRFGKEAVASGRNVQTTSFLGRKEGTLLEQSWYRVKFIGISLAGKRLEISFNVPSHKVLVIAISSYFSLARYFCLQILEEAAIKILGAYQQRDIRFLYDLGNNKLSFASDNY
ncbi:hypothetical protein ACS0TY_018719 [Phlomoides rotata]